ncbi:hypothetical protein PAHAL_2G313800 [Panicum hallii]|uniref:Uncharacterized protein n=1 Tax=Panicum hallii TaxID=206008 RepID=A0A2S3H153_9POAL|nr:uncharacterized protein LOC112882915 [Panicum hallii]XP_025803896.1 uncharacterized protein LOC112882915 [Panicum hallii]XP_025803897.1 uncharacterized protein LOC112882915 [Panicum hallii]PAN13096.1 hypothetical protein PAHAL_2G313800 [Panicum hallii]PAN13097.1 hypothetical protein PAHAL_2G313800 [Panicum hallii]
MGRPRGGKAKRPTPQATKSEEADAASGDEEAVMPAYKRRGRPHKHLKAEDTDEEEDGAKVEHVEDSDGAKPVVPSKGSTENGGKKRRRRRQPNNKGGCDSAAGKDEAVKQSGFRHHGSRRKSTPRRAAEAGVECK